MKKVKSRSFKLNPVAASIVLAMATQLSANVAYGNAGYGVNTDITGKTIAVPTYYANSPQGWQPALGADHLPQINPATGNPYTAAEAYAANGNSTSGKVVPMINTGTALRKFVDPLAGAYLGVDGLPTAGIPMGIPVGIPDQWVDENLKPVNGNTDDYYEYAIVEYKEQMHSDLANPTRLRGYVQVETPNILAKGLKDQTGIIGTEHIQGKYINGENILKDPNGPDDKSNWVYFVHAPHYLGPTILAAKGKAVRFLVHNYLPYTDVNGISHGSISGNGGEFPMPVDEYIPGGGPLFKSDGTPLLDKNGKPIKFAQNRAAIHWHGGDAPWISDGTPHQWFTPAGDISWSLKDADHPNGLGQGDSLRNVPDMPDPGPGSMTLYYPTNLSGRLMMYHDHVSGLTKLNAYAGEAAGYLVYDPVELTMAANALGTTLATTTPFAGHDLPIGLLDSIGIPLVIQDKMFVPKNMGTPATALGSDAIDTSGQFQSQDAKWDMNHWGHEGDLFFPHVYEVNQDPNSIDGTNPVGRWDWGPWFWPVFPSQYSLPSGNYGDVTATPEAFSDTPTVNGQAYPTMTLDPKTYRFRILSIANDRPQNLGLYVAVDAKGVPCDATTNPSPAIADPAPGETKLLAACTEMKMVPATTESHLPAGWPIDSRAGGVPDPTTAGPDIVQIGSEGGIFPTPMVLPAQPVTYEQDVRSMTVFNVLNHQLLIMPGERADVFVDFSKYAGKTLILYNDAPAPMPGFDPRIDYFTGAGDQTQNGGAYDTLPGYGPNTRTVMQIKISNVAPGKSLDVAALKKALPVAYAATQAAPLVPESGYNTAFGTSNGDNYARIFTGSNSAPDFGWNNPALAAVGVLDANNKVILGSGVTVTKGGSGYTSVPTVKFNGTLLKGRGGSSIDATGTAIVDVNGVVTGITVDNPGTGYDSTKPLTVTLVPKKTKQGVAIGSGATATVQTHSLQFIKTINKAIQELFDPVYGRMNATLAVELPFSTSTIATTIPLAYVDAPIENMDAISDGETQIWKITHNGVDSHPVHFHMVNVQVINRVDWAGVVKPPALNEMGWKETVRMNPLEDVYVAVKAVRPLTPFGVPASQRVLDPSQGVGSQFGFTQIDQMTGQAPTFQRQLVNGVMTDVAATAYSNQLTDFDNEYVWHCHILGHEENDFMRPFVFHPFVSTPDAPGKVTLSGSKVTWADPTPFGGQDADGIPTAGYDVNGNLTNSPKNEIGFRVQQRVTNVVATEQPQTTTTYTITSATVAINNFSQGSGYTGVPVVTINGTKLSGTAPTVTATVSGGKVTSVTISASIAIYSSKPTISIASPGKAKGQNSASAPTITTPSTTIIAKDASGNILYQASKQSKQQPAPVVTTLATVPANTTSWTDTKGLIAVPAAPVVSVDPTSLVRTTTTQTVAAEVIAFNNAKDSRGKYAGDSAVGTATTAASGSATNAGAVAGAAAATAATQALVTTATVAAQKAADAEAAVATAAAAQTAADAALAAVDAQNPLSFTAAAATPAVSGALSMTWANNPANISASGYTNVSGYTLSWTQAATPVGSGAPVGSASFGAKSRGATVTGLTPASYDFSLVAKGANGKSSTAATVPAVVAP